MRTGKVLYCGAIWLGLACLVPTGNVLAQTCGDGIVDGGEQCDDGMNVRASPHLDIEETGLRVDSVLLAELTGG